MYITKVEDVYFVNKQSNGLVVESPKHRATHVAIITNLEEAILISVDCENFYMIKEAIL